jgi:hypothetical protein
VVSGKGDDAWRMATSGRVESRKQNAVSTGNHKPVANL